MLSRTVLCVALLLVAAPSLLARERVWGWAEQGGGTVKVNGIAATITPGTANRDQRSYPNATVTVYAAGTTNLSTIYSDNSGTAKANPFTASSTGYWFFYVDNGRYDVKISGTGVPAPMTLGDIVAFDGSVSSGISTLNTLTAATQTFAVGTTGTDFNIASATSTHTFHIPSASAANRGLVTTAAQTFAGPKTFGTVSFAPSAGISTEDIFTKTGPVIDVRAHGAVAGSGDDTVAVQAAVSALPANGGSIFFPAGTWQLDNTVTITTPNVTIYGVGQNSIITLNSVSKTGFLITQTVALTGDPRVRPVVFHDITFTSPGGVTRGAGAGTAGDNGAAIHYRTAVGSFWAGGTQITRCYFTRQYNAIRLTDTAVTHVYENIFWGSEQAEVWLEKLDGTHGDIGDIHITNNTFFAPSYSAVYGVYITGLSGIYIRGNKFLRYDHGVYLDIKNPGGAWTNSFNSNILDVSNNHFDELSSNGIYIKSGATAHDGGVSGGVFNVHIIDNQIETVPVAGRGIWIDGGTTYFGIISGNRTSSVYGGNEALVAIDVNAEDLQINNNFLQNVQTGIKVNAASLRVWVGPNKIQNVTAAGIPVDLAVTAYGAKGFDPASDYFGVTTILNASIPGLLNRIEGGAVTRSSFAGYLENRTSSTTNSIDRYGLFINLPGQTWSGGSANRSYALRATNYTISSGTAYGIYVDTVLGSSDNSKNWGIYSKSPVAIGDNYSANYSPDPPSYTPHASAMLDVYKATPADSAAGANQTFRGFLPPRLTDAERALINGGTPATGLVIFNTTRNKLSYYNGSAWVELP